MIRQVFFVLFVVLLLLVGCGGDNAPPPTVLPTVVPTALPTLAPPPTALPSPTVVPTRVVLTALPMPTVAPTPTAAPTLAPPPTVVPVPMAPAGPGLGYVVLNDDTNVTATGSGPKGFPSTEEEANRIFGTDPEFWSWAPCEGENFCWSGRGNLTIVWVNQTWLTPGQTIDGWAEPGLSEPTVLFGLPRSLDFCPEDLIVPAGYPRPWPDFVRVDTHTREIWLGWSLEGATIRLH